MLFSYYSVAFLFSQCFCPFHGPFLLTLTLFISLPPSIWDILSHRFLCRLSPATPAPLYISDCFICSLMIYFFVAFLHQFTHFFLLSIFTVMTIFSRLSRSQILPCIFSLTLMLLSFPGTYVAPMTSWLIPSHLDIPALPDTSFFPLRFATTAVPLLVLVRSE